MEIICLFVFNVNYHVIDHIICR